KDSPGIDRSGRILRKAVLPVTALMLLVALKLNIKLIFSSKDFITTAQSVLTILIIATVAWISVNFIQIIRLLLLNRYDMSTKDNLRARKVYTQFRILERIIIFIIIFMAIAIALMTFDSIRKIGFSLFASAGVAGIILGLAAQQMIGTILAGFQIAITQPIRIEDVVIVEGEWGWIEEITLTYVVVRIWDKRRLVVPTTYFIQKPFQNWTRTSAEILGTVFLYTDYTMPVDELRKEFERLLKASEYWDGNVGNIQITNSTERTMEIRMLMSAVDSPTAWDLRVYIREKLIEYMQTNHPDKLPVTRVFLPEDRKSEKP
ncbi:MAG TPA: mechanosensitive ion channel domain-containing protein, partial [Bacteroidales bacterium]|nr:mechanosensitive ion channel domain-containing protein [Bacteroidales bacterium]